jgi:hypothetical protein
MKPMLYTTKNKGLAEVSGYDGYGRTLPGDALRVVYDDTAREPELLKDDNAFADWVGVNNAKYLGNYLKYEAARERLTQQYAVAK